MELSGVVERQHVARGSKSDRVAVVLVTPRRRYWLRRRGEHPFQDPVLDRLVGQRLRGEGSVAGPWFILDRWETLGDEG
jgi:hypothetical protein